MVAEALTMEALNPKNSCKIWGREHVFVIPVLQQ